MYDHSLTTSFIVEKKKERKNQGKPYDSYLLSHIFHFFSGYKPEQLIPSFGLFRLFHRLYIAVTSDLLDKMATNKRNDNKKTAKEKSRTKNKTKTTIFEDETLENRFTLLGAEQWDDDDT